MKKQEVKKTKFRIGDLASFKESGDIVIAQITQIIFDECGDILYGLTGVDNAKYENDLTPYQEDEVKTETTEEEKVLKLPKTWKEACEYMEKCTNRTFAYRLNEINVIIYHIEDHASDITWQHIAFMKLILLRDIYRQGWKPDWQDNSQKYALCFYDGKVRADVCTFLTYPLVFQTSKLRDRFFKNFKELIEECKKLI